MAETLDKVDIQILRTLQENARLTTKELASQVSLSSTPVFVAGPTLLRDPVVTEFQQYAAKVFPIHPAADFNRHIVATTDGVPYDLVCALLRRRV